MTSLDGILNVAMILVLAGAVSYFSCLGSTSYWE